MEPRRPSYEILKDLIDQVGGMKRFVYELRVSDTLGREWVAEPDGPDAGEIFGLAARKANPLDRTRDILRLAMTEGHEGLALEMLNWLAREVSACAITDDERAGLADTLEKILARLENKPEVKTAAAPLRQRDKKRRVV